MSIPLALTGPDDRCDLVELAVFEDHERIRMLLSRFREAWLNGHDVRRWFHRLEAAVRRHLLWEERELVDPVRSKLDQVCQYQVLQRDRQMHRELCDTLTRVHGLLPQRSFVGHETDRRILEQIEELEVMLGAHRSIFEAQVRVAVYELHARTEHAGVARALHRRPAGRPN